MEIEAGRNESESRLEMTTVQNHLLSFAMKTFMRF